VHHGFYFSYRIGGYLQETVYFGQFILCLRTLAHGDPASVLGAHLCRNDYLCTCDAHDLVPADIGLFLQLESVLGDGHYPVGQHGQIQVCLDAAVALMIDGAYVKVCLQDMEGFFHHS